MILCCVCLDPHAARVCFDFAVGAVTLELDSEPLDDGSLPVCSLAHVSLILPSAGS